jgi:hypothetical protein
LILITGTLLLPASVGALPRDPFADDDRLRRTLTIRVSGMPLGELLQRAGAELDVPLFAEGDDVADQKITLFACDLPAPSLPPFRRILALPPSRCRRAIPGSWATY